MTTRTHTYSDGSQIELGGGIGWVRILQGEDPAKPATSPAPRKRKIIGREALRAQPSGKEF